MKKNDLRDSLTVCCYCFSTMSGEPEVTRTPEEEGDEEEIKSSYRPPPEKTIDEILAADQEDESLRKYKEALLGEAQAGAVIVGK